MALKNQQAVDPEQRGEASTRPRRPIASHLARRIALATAALTLATSGLVFGALGWDLAGRFDPEARHQAWVSLSIGLGLLAVAVIVAVAWLVQRLLHRRIERLASAIGSASRGDYLIRVDDESADELGELARGFNRLLAKITDLQVNVIDADRELASAKRELSLTEELARKAAIIEQQARDRAARVRELELLIRSAETISSMIGLDQVLDALVAEAGRTLEFAEAAILLRAPDGAFQVRATYGFEDGSAIVGMSFASGEGITGEVVRTGQPQLIEDTSKDKRYLHYKQRHLVDGSFLCLPIANRHGLVGLFNMLRPRSKGFEESEIRLLTSLATHAGIAIANAQLVDRLERLSLTDSLTGLANRRCLEIRGAEAIAEARRREAPLALLMVNIDRFKEYNDQHGHLRGDEALMRVSRLLMAQLRPDDLLARWGGEEFLALLPGVDAEQARDAAERIRSAVKEEGLGLTVSAGVAHLPENGIDLMTLIEEAARALFKAKRAGRDRTASA